MNYVLNRPSVKAELPLKHATPQEQKETVLEWVADTGRQVIAQECYPTLYRQEDEYRQGWGYRSLLGAMYLQMMQLITTTGEVRKCKGPDCWRIITFKPGEPPVNPGFKKNVRGKYTRR